MVVDILKTDEGKKAIQDVMSDEKLRQELDHGPICCNRNDSKYINK